MAYMATPPQPVQPLISSAYDRRLSAFGNGVATPGALPVNQNMNPGVGTLQPNYQPNGVQQPVQPPNQMANPNVATIQQQPTAVPGTQPVATQPVVTPQVQAIRGVLNGGLSQGGRMNTLVR